MVTFLILGAISNRFVPLLLHPFSQLSNLPIYNCYRRNNHQNLNSILLPLFSRGMKRRCFNFNLKKLLTLPSLSLSLFRGNEF